MRKMLFAFFCIEFCALFVVSFTAQAETTKLRLQVSPLGCSITTVTNGESRLDYVSPDDCTQAGPIVRTVIEDGEVEREDFSFVEQSDDLVRADSQYFEIYGDNTYDNLAQTVGVNKEFLQDSITATAFALITTLATIVLVVLFTL